MLAQQCMYFEKHLLTVKQPCFIILHCWCLLLKERENSSLDASKKKKKTKNCLSPTWSLDLPLCFPSSDFCLAAKELSSYLGIGLSTFSLYQLGLLFLFIG